MRALEQDVPIPEGFLAEWCETMAHGTEMPPAAYLSTGLAVAATIIGARLRIKWAPAHQERCNLFLLNVGRSALARKTTGLSAARWAIKVAEGELGDAVRWYAANRLSDAQLAYDLDVVTRDREAAQEAADRQAKLEKCDAALVGESDVVRRVPVAWLMAVNEVAPMWGEGLRDWQRATADLLLTVFDGRLSSSTRTTNVPEQETFVCALGNMPPSELATRTTLGIVTSGFVGRWLVMPSPGPVHEIATPRPNGSDPLATIGEHVVRLARLAARGPVIEHVGAELMPASSPGDVARARWYHEWHAWARRAVDADGDPIEVARAVLWGRQQAHALKLAAIVAVTRQAHLVERLDEVRIEAFDALWAQEVVDRSVAALIAAVHAGGGGAATALGRTEARVLNVVRVAGGVDEAHAIPLREVTKRAKGSDGHGEVVRAIENLASIGEIEIGERRPNGPGRPSRVVWLAG